MNLSQDVGFVELLQVLLGVQLPLRNAFKRTNREYRILNHVN